VEIFEFESYKAFVRARIEAMPGRGRGEFRAIARKLRMHTTLVSQVFRGPRELTPEQACDLCGFWGLSGLETEMFLALVQYERAGTTSLRAAVLQQLRQIRQRADKLAYRLPQEKVLRPETQQIFYSNWHYSAIRLLTSIADFNDVDAIANHLGLARNVVAEALEFLVNHALCKRLAGGKVKMGPQRTHLPADSPMITRHHLNWRVRNLSRLQTENLGEDEILFTAPLSISVKDARKVRKKILEFTEGLSQVVKDTDPEKVCVLNIDWLNI
jgi:uncharacterized protein (TIGR02147 family)